jgi:hypothetical protein
VPAALAQPDAVVPGVIDPAQFLILSPDVPDTVILSELR